MGVFVVFTVFLLIVFTLLLSTYFNRIQVDPYMDEVFHFPQALKYFHGRFFEWDPKITTPPGLYLASIGILVPISKILGYELSGISSFRLTNLFFTLGNFYLLLQILQRIQKKGTTDSVLLLTALHLATFPVLYFFTFLYYTDCGSVFFVLLLYLHHLQQQYWLAAAFGALAVLFRQTNIVWVFMMAAQVTLSTLTDDLGMKKRRSFYKEENQHLKTFLDIIRQKYFSKTSGTQTFLHMLYANVGYFLVGVGFLIFLFINKSITLGDKEAHQPCMNIPQILYFLLFILFFASPCLVDAHKIINFMKFVKVHKKLTLLLFSLCLLSLKYFTYVHPYLLADNRHLTFYLWRKLLGRNFFLSASLIPACIFCGWSMLRELQHKELSWRLVFGVCVILATIPQKLLELRYFIVPYIIFRLNIRVRGKMQLLCEFALNIIVNCFTMYIFFNKTFLWENDSSIQRIIW